MPSSTAPAQDLPSCSNTDDPDLMDWFNKLTHNALSPEAFTEAAIQAISGKDRPILKIYEKQFPCVGELRCYIMAARQVMDEFGHAEMDCPVFEQSKIPGNAKGYRTVLQAVMVMNNAVEALKAATALVNHLATGRKKLQYADGEPPLFPLLLLRPPPAKICDAKSKETMTDRASAYTTEFYWLFYLARTWEKAAEEWRVKHGVKESSLGKEKILPLYQSTVDAFRAKPGAMQCGSSTIEEVASRLSDLEEVTLEDWSKKDSTDSTALAAVGNYLNAMETFAEQWGVMLISMPIKGEGPIETLLACTFVHVKILENRLEEGQELLQACTQLEEVLHQAAEDGSFDNLALLLPLCSFDLDSPTAYRDVLIRSLGPRKDFCPTTMPKRLLQWQKEKVEEAISALKDVIKDMDDWIKEHGDDGHEQGIHLNVGRRREPDEIMAFSMVDGMRAAALPENQGKDPLHILGKAIMDAHMEVNRYHDAREEREKKEEKRSKRGKK